MARSYGDYTTNLPLKDLRNKQAWIAFRFDGEDLAPEHGGPARLLVPHLYFWKSAKWVRGITLMHQDKPGFWESLGYHIYGDPWREQPYSGEGCRALAQRFLFSPKRGQHAPSRSQCPVGRVTPPAHQ